MPGFRLATLVRRLRRDASPGGGCSDAELLGRFTRTRDAAAFELLVWRHGAMVLSACRRVLGHTEDAEDAFQATFLVLARKAAGVSRGTALPAWLHRVAVRVALRFAGSRKPAAPLETDPAASADADPLERDELRGVLDEEVNRLPDRLRRAVVLCYLEGLTAAEASRQLGCPTGTVESRLAAGRAKLRDRLTRRGVSLPAGILAVATGPSLGREAVGRVVRAAVAFAREGSAAASGIAGESSVRLARGVLVMGTVRTWAVLVLGAAVVAMAVDIGWASRPAVAARESIADEGQPPAAPAKADPKAWPLARQLPGVSGRLLGVTPDGRSVILHDGEHVYGLDLGRPGRTASFQVHSPNAIADAALSPDGKVVATAEGIHGVKLRDAATGKVTEALWPSGGLPAVQVAFVPDGTKLVVLCSRVDRPSFGKFPGKGKEVPRELLAKLNATKITDKTQVSVWDVATRKELGHPVETIEVGVARLPSYSLSENGRFVLKAEVLPAEAPGPDRPGGGNPFPGAGLPQFGGPGAAAGPQVRGGTTPEVRFTVIDALTGTAGKPVELRDPNLALSTQWLSPDGKTVAVLDAGHLTAVRQVDMTTGKERASLGPLRRPVKAVGFSPDGKLIAAASGLAVRTPPPRAIGPSDQLAAPSEVVIWDAATGKELARLTDKESIRDYRAVRFSPDGSFVVAQDADRLLTVWGRSPEPVKPEPKDVVPSSVGKGKSKEPPPAPPAAAPDRFESLIRDLSADGVTDQRRVEGVFLAALGRFPTDVEARSLVSQIAKRTDKTEALRDLLFVLTQAPEFKAHAEAIQRLAK
jgi:RNA polymerase sigma factor (sigma-70 family)